MSLPASASTYFHGGSSFFFVPVLAKMISWCSCVGRARQNCWFSCHSRFAPTILALPRKFAPQYQRQVAVIAEQYVGAADQFGQDRARIAVPRVPQHCAIIAVEADRNAEPLCCASSRERRRGRTRPKRRGNSRQVEQPSARQQPVEVIILCPAFRETRSRAVAPRGAAGSRCRG